MKKLLALIAVFTLTATLFAGCTEKNDDSSSSAVNDDKVLVVGLDDSFPPMGFRDENNEIVGFDIDLAKEVAKKMGMEVKFQPIDWDSKELELNGDKIDCIWNGLSVDAERQEKMLLSKSYLANSQVIVTKPDSNIKSKADLKGKKVALQKGSTALKALEKDPIAKEVKEIIQMPDNVSALQDLKLGRVDAVVLDEVVGNYYVAKDSKSYVVLGDKLNPEEYAVAFKKGNTKLHDKFAKAFKEIVDDGTAAKISEKWFGQDKILK